MNDTAPDHSFSGLTPSSQRSPAIRVESLGWAGSAPGTDGGTRWRLTPHPSHLTAFSLLELLAVLLIIGIVATMAVLSVGTADSERLLHEEARRLAALVDLSCEEAVLRSDTFAVSFGPGGTGYGFLRQAGEQWLPRADNDWRPRALPEGFSAKVRVEGREVVLDEEGAGRPHLVCLASGELVPFEVMLHAPGTETAWRVAGAWDGDVSIGSVDSK